MVAEGRSERSKDGGEGSRAKLTSGIAPRRAAKIAKQIRRGARSLGSGRSSLARFADGSKRIMLSPPVYQVTALKDEKDSRGPSYTSACAEPNSTTLRHAHLKPPQAPTSTHTHTRHDTTQTAPPLPIRPHSAQLGAPLPNRLPLPHILQPQPPSSQHTPYHTTDYTP